MGETHVSGMRGKIPTARNSSPSDGDMRWDTTDNYLDIYDGAVWRGIALTTSTSTSSSTSTTT